MNSSSRFQDGSRRSEAGGAERNERLDGGGLTTHSGWPSTTVGDETVIRHPPIRIIKLGGSLMDKTGMPAELHAWLARQQPAGNIIIAGGGRMTDEVREWDRRHVLGEVAAHWLCVRVMSITARASAAMLGDVPLADSLVEAMGCAAQRALCVLDVARFLRNDEPQRGGTRIAHDWSVSSDSIAARVAGVLSANELVLLKSTSPPEELSIGSVARCGYIDGFLPRLAEELAAVRCVNARAPGWPDWLLRLH